MLIEAAFMSAEIQSIVNAVRELNPEQRQQLAEALALIDADHSAASNRQEWVQAIRGKYRHIPTSSEAFLRRKAEETALESRR